jgi:hypothetical protein
MSDDKVYVEIPVFTEAEITSELHSDDPNRVATALFSSVRYSDNWKSAKECCLERLKAPEIKVRWAAATCLGDLAFFLNRPIDHQRVLAALYEAAEDESIADPALFSISLIRQKFPEQ